MQTRYHYPYPTTRDYMANILLDGKVISLSGFDMNQKMTILQLFLDEVTVERLDELNEDYFPEPKLERAVINMDAISWSKTRAQTTDALWEKYDTELQKIFDQANDDYWEEDRARSRAFTKEHRVASNNEGAYDVNPILKALNLTAA